MSNALSRSVAAAICGLVFCGGVFAADEPAPITHSFLATGAETFIVDGTGKTTWSYPRSSRDGWVLPNGNILLALSKSNDGGSVVEVTREGKVVFEFKGTQSEVPGVAARHP